MDPVSGHGYLGVKGGYGCVSAVWVASDSGFLVNELTVDILYTGGLHFWISSKFSKGYAPLVYYPLQMSNMVLFIQSALELVLVMMYSTVYMIQMNW